MKREIQLKDYLRKIYLRLGLDINIEKSVIWKNYIPSPYKSVLLISADFELAWAWQYTKSENNALNKAIRMARQERHNIPNIVELCDVYNIPITWATVGHLFLDGCTKTNGIPHADLPRLDYFENRFWKFTSNDWFQNDPCTNYLDAPEWYCPDLIRIILAAKAKHEIGCHTFSHIDCRDEACPPSILRKELNLSQQLAEQWGLKLKSFVHPGHTIGNLDVLADEGFTNYRTDYRNVLGYPKQHPNGLWELEQTMEFSYYDYLSDKFQVNRYIRLIKRAIETNTVCVLWFHPSFSPLVIEKIWPKVFEYIDLRRNEVWVATHSEYINWLNRNEN